MLALWAIRVLVIWGHQRERALLSPALISAEVKRGLQL